MSQDKVHILPTKTTPEVLLTPKGTIKIKGRAIDEGKAIVPEQITSWIDSYVLSPAESTEVTIALEFLNSYNTIVLTSLLRKVSQVTKKGRRLAIHWYYEEDDVDIYERGEYISSTINVPIEFEITDNIDEC